MPLSNDWLKTALSITGDFETSGDPFAGVTGDFDQMGISCGVLQWNIGMGSLQPLIKETGLTVVKNKMPTFGQQLWEACHATISAGLAIVRQWQSGSRLQPTARTELEKLFGSDEMVRTQMKFAANTGNRAFALATNWAADARAASQPTLHEFCWFFDLIVLNGGMREIWLPDVDNFIEGHGETRADDVICDWLQNLTGDVYGRNDARKNAALWRNKVAPENLKLFVLGYLRALKSRNVFQGVVVNRRGTIALTKGVVNGELEDFAVLRA